MAIAGPSNVRLRSQIYYIQAWGLVAKLEKYYPADAHHSEPSRIECSRNHYKFEGHVGNEMDYMLGWIRRLATTALDVEMPN